MLAMHLYVGADKIRASIEPPGGAVAQRAAEILRMMRRVEISSGHSRRPICEMRFLESASIGAGATAASRRVTRRRRRKIDAFRDADAVPPADKAPVTKPVIFLFISFLLFTISTHRT